MTIRRNARNAGAIVLVLAMTAVAEVRPTPATPPVEMKESPKEIDKSPRIALGSSVERDIAYVETGADQQRLDVYSPADARACPVVIFVHGGEWTKGDKSEVSFKPKFFNENGVVFVSLNYRLSGTAKHPAQVEDVAAAVRWIRDSIDRYGGDPQELVLMGHSAGCHLVTLVALDPRPLARVNLSPTDLKGVVSWSGGAFDLVAKVKSGGMYADYIRLNFGDDERDWRDASPMSHVGESKPMPRFLFASVEKGNPASREASDKIASLICDAGGTAETVVLAGKDHSAANHEVGQPGDTTGDILLRFVRDATR